MPEQSLTFGFQASGFDALSGASPVAHNVVIDATGAVRRRPGIIASSDFYSGVINSNGIIGLHGTYSGELYAVSGEVAFRKVYQVTSTAGVLLTNDVGSALTGTERPVFAETEAMVAIAGGADLQKIQFSTGVSSRLGGSPPMATHVIANSQRLLCNDSADLSRVKFSETASGSSIAGHEVWLGGDSGYFNAEARADGITGLYELAGDLYVFGATTLQVWGADPTAAYAPITTSEQGLSAPYSVIRKDQALAYADDRRRLVLSDGRGQETLSEPIQDTLDRLSNWSSMFGYRVKMGPVDCLCWTVPGGQTFALQQDGGWSTWSGWSGTNWLPFSVGASAYLPLTQQTVVGTTDGKVGLLSQDSATDFGSPIRAYAETGFVDGGTSAKKRSKFLRLVFRRTSGFSSDSSMALLSWRDDLGAWNPPIELDLSRSLDFQVVITLRSLGVYRMRQWRISFEGGAPYLLAKATEDFDVMES